MAGYLPILDTICLKIGQNCSIAGKGVGVAWQGGTNGKAGMKWTEVQAGDEGTRARFSSPTNFTPLPQAPKAVDSDVERTQSIFSYSVGKNAGVKLLKIKLFDRPIKTINARLAHAVMNFGP
jgi:hypothetical protein